MAKVAEMLPALSGTTEASCAPSVPFHFSTTGAEADALAELTLKDEPVTVTWSPALPAVLDRLRVARLVHANAAAPAMTDAAAAAPKTVVTFLRRFISRLPTFSRWWRRGGAHDVVFLSAHTRAASRARQ